MSFWTRSKHPEARGLAIVPLTRSAAAVAIFALIIGGALAGGLWGITLVGLLVALLMLREFLAYADHELRTSQAMVLALCMVTAVSFWFAFQGWTLAVAAFIPFTAFFVLPVLHTFTPQPGFLHRTSVVQWSLMLSVYGLCHLPVMVQLPSIAARLDIAPENTLLMTVGAHFVIALLATIPLSLATSYITSKVYRKSGFGFISGLLTALLLALATSWALPLPL